MCVATAASNLQVGHLKIVHDLNVWFGLRCAVKFGKKHVSMEAHSKQIRSKVDLLEIKNRVLSLVDGVKSVDFVTSL